MKFRTDFVTNSSSNSYVVNLAVKPLEGDTIKFDLYPDKWERSNERFELRSSVNKIAGKVINCKTIGELTRVLIEESSEGDIKRIIEDFNDDYNDDDEDDEEGRVDLKTEVQGKIQRFNEKMAEFSSLDELDSVIISEIYSGWGECAYDTVKAYLKRIHPDATSSKIDEMVEDLCGRPFIPYGWVNTIIKIEGGVVSEEHNLSL